MRDPYIILGVSRSADLQDIKTAWRNAAKLLHPDQNPNDPDAAARFTEIGRAYDLLKDAEKRRRYDEAQLRASTAANAGAGTSRGAKEPTFMERRAERAREEAEARAAEARAAAAAAAAAAAMHPDGGEAEIQQAEDVVARIFGTRKTAQASASASAQASQSYGAAQSAAGQATAQSYAAAAGRTDSYAAPREEFGADYAASEAAIDNRPSPALDLLSYLVKRLTRQVPAPDKAPDLAIDALISVEDLYGRVNPTVSLPDGKLVSVTLPEDAKDGSVVRIDGQGHRLPGMKRGDVVATLRVKPHAWYRPDGHDLRAIHHLDIENAVLGCQTMVETPQGQVRIAVPEWSGSDRNVRIEGQGLAKGNGRRGDLIVEIRVMLWDRPDQKVIDLMRSLREGLYL